LFGFSSTASTRGVPIAEPVPVAQPAPISDAERLSRYVTNDEHFSVAKNTVHFRAFLPRPRDNELSIMRTEALAEPDVWALGDSVAVPSGRSVYARGDLVAPDVRASFVDPWRLSVRADDDPPRHALIEGWPPVQQSEIRKSLAQQLRANARLAVRPVV
jgi:hypothetical protein